MKNPETGSYIAIGVNVCSIAVANRDQEIVVERIQTGRSHTSVRSRLSRIASLASSRRKKEREQLPPTIHPVSDLENGIVGWDSQDDPAMPMNFPARRKWIIIWFLSGITFMTPFASSILAPAIEYLNEDYGNTDLTLGTLPVSIYLLGYAVGPLFLAPLSEIYGRRPVLTTANVFFCAWLIGCALAPSLNSLIVFRFLTGVGGSGCLAIGGGVIADMIPIQDRGKALTIWMMGPLIGNLISATHFVKESNDRAIWKIILTLKYRTDPGPSCWRLYCSGHRLALVFVDRLHCRHPHGPRHRNLQPRNQPPRPNWP